MLISPGGAGGAATANSDSNSGGTGNATSTAEATGGAGGDGFAGGGGARRITATTALRDVQAALDWACDRQQSASGGCTAERRRRGLRPPHDFGGAGRHGATPSSTATSSGAGNASSSADATGGAGGDVTANFPGQRRRRRRATAMANASAQAAGRRWPRRSRRAVLVERAVHARSCWRRECNIERRDRKRRVGSSAIDCRRIERTGPIDREDQSCRRQAFSRRLSRRPAAARRRPMRSRRAALGSGLRQSRPDGLRLLNRPSRTRPTPRR